ncbi:uncharacterized protein LOC124114665 isoform X2 [Haliotis rufescens]|uniref:uncharacterized protein LOC124114665 isoform X2 n=1 Tax=Haliotis rufescens TaxID=6454 RepID=UPI00201E84F6|nr:uncharacterized protein LOC124114665 isoform X2 [Haliotis rufescens]
MLTKATVIWAIITLDVGAAVDTDYFKCHRDLCRRGEQYCVEERQRCYHCADVAHLCNTSEISRECDSYCNRVTLEEMTKKKDKTFSEMTDVKTKLHSEQNTTTKMKMRITKLNTMLSQLNESRNALLVDNREYKRRTTEHEDVVKQNERLRATLIGVCTASGVLGVVVIILTGILCSQKQDKSKSPHTPAPEKEKLILYQLPDQLPALLPGVGDYVTIDTKSHTVDAEGAIISRASRPKIVFLHQRHELQQRQCTPGI